MSQQLGRAEKEEFIAKSTVQLEGAYRKFDLTDSEACILKSFRLEEYYDIRERMKNEDRDVFDRIHKENPDVDIYVKSPDFLPINCRNTPLLHSQADQIFPGIQGQHKGRESFPRL